MPDYVHLHHPEVDGCAEAPSEAFEAVWAEKGWELADTYEGQTVFTHELEQDSEDAEEDK
jgi:hypothetical protein